MIDASFATLAPDPSVLASLRFEANASQDAKEVGRQFEALFLSLILNQMRQTTAGDGMFPGDQSDTFGAMFDQYMGEALAENGGMGLAAYVEQSLVKSVDAGGRGSR